jgi:uridine kinase
VERSAYSTRPELADLIDLKILIDVLVTVRHERLNQHEKKEFLLKWHERWDEPEQYYFQHLRPAAEFDLEIEN